MVVNRGTRLTFSNINIEDNTQTTATSSYRKWSYDVFITPSNHKLIHSLVKDKAAVVRLDITQTNGYNVDEISGHIQFTSLPPEPQVILKSCYKEIDPKKCVTLLTADQTNSIKIGDYDFVDDSVLVSKGIITMIYNLRNTLFHGQLIPDSNAQLVYEPAYHVLHMLVASLN